MPKQTYIINEFHGGVNSNADPRDIDKSESPDVSASIDNFGKIRTVGEFDKGDASNNSTAEITHKHGLFVMGSDTQIDNSAADETLIFHYDFGTKIDVYDSDGWHTNEITTGSNAKPTYFSADGILRVGDVSLNTGYTRWYGHVNRTIFAGLGCAEAIDDWKDETAYPVTPSQGHCLISTPYAGGDSTGPNSAKSEYIGVIGSSLIDMVSLNLRVGIKSAKGCKITGDGLNTGDVNVFPSGNSNTNPGYNYRYYLAGTDGVYTADEDVYPLLFNQNILVGAKEAQNINDERSSGLETTSDFLTSYTLSESMSVLVGIYFWELQYDNVETLTIKLGTDSETGNSNCRVYEFSSKELSVGWNAVVCEQGMQSFSQGTPPAYGDRFSYIKIEVKQKTKNVPDGGANSQTDIPKFYISGPANVPKAGALGFTTGKYTFGYTWIYDDVKQESMIKTFNDTDASTSPYELNSLNIVGGTLFLTFDIYTASLHASSKRIYGSRIYYKKESDDNHYLIGECDFIDKGFKFFPEAETYDYSFIDVTSTTSNLANAVIISGITPESANFVDTWKSLNGFYQKVDSLEAKWKTGTVQGRRAYVGNVKQDGKFYPDRMLKSKVNHFDVFPDKDSIVDVAVRDGENIVKLESFADRVLQFKEKTLYIINVSQGSEFLESVHPFMGINYEYHSVETERGVAFFNEHGAYLYNGSDIIDLLEKNGKVLISEDTWNDFISYVGSTVDSSIGYAPKKHQIVFLERNGDSYFYNLKTGAWTTCQNMLDYNDSDSRTITKLGLNGDNDMFFIGGQKSQIYKYDHTPSPTHDFNYITRDIDFGDPSVRKKVYKVYMTYKTGANKLPNIICKFDTNGAGSYDKLFASSTNYSEYVTGLTGAYYSLARATNWTTVELKPATSSEANNIYSFALSVSIGSVHSGTLASADSTTAITLDSGASAVDDFYNNMTLTTWSGLRKGETVRVTDYVGSTKVATVSPAFSDTVDNTTKFIVGLVPSSFEINDITIVYRIKSIK